jgi:hypothetical protein
MSGEILDPRTCGEDFAHNARRVVEVAPSHCAGCEDYHVIFAVKRGRSRPAGIENDRPKLVDFIGRYVVQRLAGPDAVDIVIVGSADTGILATCAHAVTLHAGPEASRVRYTVLDLCPTPLVLCRDYANRHGLALTTRPVDLVATTERFPADLIVHHSLFNFLPRGARPGLLAKFGSWLKPAGQVLFAIEIHPQGYRSDLSRRTDSRKRLLDEVRAGQVKIYEPIDRFARRLADHLRAGDGREGTFTSTDEIRSLGAAAGLSILSLEAIDVETATATGATRGRVIAMLGV